MLRDDWARLARPFPPQALAWCVAELAQEGDSVRLEPVVSAPLVIERLDQVAGVGGWENRYVPFGSDALVCELRVGGVTKSAMARSPAPKVDAGALADSALAKAAALFGVRPPADASAAYWVDADPETGEPLFLPEPLPPRAEPRGSGSAEAPRAADLGPRAVGAVPETAGEGESSGDASAAAGDADASTAPAAGSAQASAAAEAPAAAPGPRPEGGPVRPQGHQVIERLMDRLKAEGLGREAARLVVSYGGYGRTTEEARDLYKRLRELLLEKGSAAS